MAVITLPSKVHFEEVSKLQLLRAGATIRSRYTGKRQSVRFPFALWVLEGTLIPMEGLDAGEWRSFLVELQGEQNTFRLPVPGWSGPLSGYAGPVPTVSSAATRARSFTMSGCTPSTTVLRKGDFFTVNDELKVCTGTVSSTSGGQAVVTFEPGLRRAISSSTQVRLFDPYIYLSAQDNESGGWSLERPVRHGIELRAMEAFD